MEKLLIQGSNNTNKLSPQEPLTVKAGRANSSNNTNKLSPQEHTHEIYFGTASSNNTNKLSPQEHFITRHHPVIVQIIQINLVLKNFFNCCQHLEVFK